MAILAIINFLKLPVKLWPKTSRTIYEHVCKTLVRVKMGRKKTYHELVVFWVHEHFGRCN